MEGSEAVFEQLPRGGEESVRRRRELQRFEREQARASKRITVLAAILIAGIVLSAAIGLWQASISQKAAAAAEDAARTATDALAEMKQANAATDIHALASQPAAPTSQIPPAKPAELHPRPTEVVARSISQHTEVAPKPQSIAEAQTLPYILLAKVDLAEPIVAGRPTRLRNTFLNVGNSAAVEVHSFFRSDSFIDGSAPPYEFHGAPDDLSVIASKASFDSPMALTPLTDVQIQQFDEGVRRIFLTGEVIYADFRHTVHHTYYCFELSPRDSKMYECKNRKPSD